MEQMAQDGTGPGNTGTGPATLAKANPNTKKSRGWFFTLNNPSEHGVETPEQMELVLETLEPRAWIFQLELGENGTIHYQGCIYLKNPRVMPKEICKSIHWERCKDWAAATKYCQKDETRVDGPWAKNVDIAKPIRIIDQLSTWQTGVKEILDDEPDDRTIYWFWEPEGNFGKTTMAKWIVKHYSAIYLSGKAGDAKYAVTKWLEHHTLHAVIFGYPRSAEEYVSYGALEEIKDGIFFNTKYESKMVVFNSPHVIIFANFTPDQTKLSKDRWYIQNIRDWDQ